MTGTHVTRRFREAYAAHRAAEGRGNDGAAHVRVLPYVARGALAQQWRVRAKTFECFMRRVVRPREHAGRALTVIDLGAGNGWLCHRLGARGHRALALDVRTDTVDGLGAGTPIWRASPPGVLPVAADFAAIPIAPRTADLVVFNASLHYAIDLVAVVREARRVARDDGAIVVLDSPFYASAADGEAMVAEKRRAAPETFGASAEVLTALPFIEYLTRTRLEEASRGVVRDWRRHRVRYPPGYELRPLVARIEGRRRPSRFDVWEGTPA